MICVSCKSPISGKEQVCPRCGQPISEVASSCAAYCLGKRLVVPKYAKLPSFCIKCGAPATGDPLMKTFRWSPPTATRSPRYEEAVVALPLCEHHRQYRRNLLMATGTFGLAMVPLGFFVGSLMKDQYSAAVAGFMTSIGMLFAMCVSFYNSALLHPTEITLESATFRGAGKQFLAILAEVSRAK